jgi:hypothetical protein
MLWLALGVAFYVETFMKEVYNYREEGNRVWKEPPR